MRCITAVDYLDRGHRKETLCHLCSDIVLGDIFHCGRLQFYGPSVGHFYCEPSRWMDWCVLYDADAPDMFWETRYCVIGVQHLNE